MAVQHHLDQPLMQINEIDISPGFETQVRKLYKKRKSTLKKCVANYILKSSLILNIYKNNLNDFGCFLLCCCSFKLR